MCLQNLEQHKTGQSMHTDWVTHRQEEGTSKYNPSVGK